MKNVLINFPSFHAGMTFTKETSFDDPKKYICIINGHAVITANEGCIVVNLKDYFENVFDVEPGEAFDELMNWVEGKNFTKEFWKELSGLQNISVVDETTLLIENESYSSHLIYTHKEVLTDAVMKKFITSIKEEAHAYSTVGIPYGVINFIEKTVGPLLKKNNNSMIAEFIQKDREIKITFKGLPCIFGIVRNTTYEVEGRAFDFEDMTDFVSGLDIE